MIDFTLYTYSNLLVTLKKNNYKFQKFQQFAEYPVEKVIILRHDVDRLPNNSLATARVENNLGIKGSYYFREETIYRDPKVIDQIFDLGHEIGYHYEDVNTVVKRQRLKGKEQLFKNSEEYEYYIISKAIENFSNNLEKLRNIAPVITICMHGSPMSRWDNRLLWKYYDYHDFGITGEPYFDICFDDVLYLTDTGRRWDGGSFSVRDKIQDSELKEDVTDRFRDWKVKPRQIKNNLSVIFGILSEIHSSMDIINAAKESKLPDRIMLTFHPQRWTNKSGPWVKELVWQNVKNVGKYFLIKLSK